MIIQRLATNRRNLFEVYLLMPALGIKIVIKHEIRIIELNQTSVAYVTIKERFNRMNKIVSVLQVVTIYALYTPNIPHPWFAM